jgi:hypothetical protein
MGGQSEYKRTCQQCGRVWFVAASELTRPRLGKTRQGAKDARELRRNSDERVKELSRCPQCRSTHFTEMRG